MRNLHIGIGRISIFVTHLSWSMVIIAFFLVSCKQSDNIEQQQLYGRWDIGKAERNGKETSYLRRGFFILEPDGMMTINITGADEKAAFTLDRNKLIMGDKNFEIQTLNADSMIVKYNTGPNVQFVFYMRKK